MGRLILPSGFALPFVAALILTALNSAKPAVIDDTAYLQFARHLSNQPADPYGWELYWYSAPQPAMEILMPPVLPYWVALGIGVLGEDNLVLLKLWLFPFALLLYGSAASLMHRFGSGQDHRSLLLVYAISPAVLPLFCVMLDIPALALGAAALASFIKGCDARRPIICAAAGLLAGLAMQTKYSMLVVPAILTAYAVIGGNGRAPAFGLLLAALTAGGLFWGWELYLIRHCGESHFLHHFQSSSVEDGGFLRKFTFAEPLLVQFGGLACGLSLACGRAAGWPVAIRGLAGLFVLGFAAAIAYWPYSSTLIGGTFALAYWGFFALGVSAALTLGLLSVRSIREKGLNPDTAFVLVWLLVEILGMLAMTPFPAARRLVGVYLAAAVLVANSAGNLRVSPERWAVAIAAVFGMFVSGVDIWDAYPEKSLADRAAAIAMPSPEHTVWFSGHWGFQYYAERNGMRPLITHRTELRAGDWLVLPDLPRDDGFYRPNPDDPNLPKPSMRLLKIATISWDDSLMAQTVPNLYGGAVPILNRDHPRLTLTIYRVTADWSPTRN